MCVCGSGSKPGAQNPGRLTLSGSLFCSLLLVSQGTLVLIHGHIHLYLVHLYVQGTVGCKWVKPCEDVSCISPCGHANRC